MRALLAGLVLSAVLLGHCGGRDHGTAYPDTEPGDLESLPLHRLLAMKKALRKNDRPAQEEDDRPAPQEQRRRWPSAMALQRRRAGPSRAATSSSVQTAFQMSLTVLSFLAFGGYVISLVAQNTRRPQHGDAALMTPPRPLKTVVVNQNRRPAQRPVSTAAPVSFGRRKRRSCDPADGNGQDHGRKCRGV